jgi:PTS system N-acetylglucosamine-specific IIA component
VRDLPDPVFARGLVGPGIAVHPRPGRQVAVAPISGTLAKVHPHAYLIVTEQGPGVLVHLGIDTVHLQGDGFEVLARESEPVNAGDDVVSWDPDLVERTGRSSVCAVVALECDPKHVVQRPVGVEVEPGDLLFEVDC